MSRRRNKPRNHDVVSTSASEKGVTAQAWSYLTKRERDIVVEVRWPDGAWSTTILRIRR